MSMDRKIQKSRKPLLIKLALVAVLGSGLAFAGYRALQDSAVSTFRVDKARVSIGAVSHGIFEDFIPVRGTVTPLKSIFLDTEEGGRVEKIFVENGAVVKAGQPIVELRNTSLQLQVLGQEAQVSEQVNNLRNTRLAIEQNRLQLKSQLIEMDYQILRLQQQVARLAPLLEKKAVTQAEYKNALDELAYYQSRRAVTIESQQQEEQLRKAQLESLETSVVQLQKNLEIAHQNLNALTITAPIDGQVNAFNVELGQSLMRGETVAKIDDTERFKLTVLVDEFYITRTREGQYGEFTLSDQRHALKISRVYPEVNNGQFEVDMQFVGTPPADIRRGQTLQTRVQLGDASEALLLPRGGFFQDTGGNWVFVLNADGSAALRRDVKLGRRNPEYFEVLEGLQAGEQVLTSEYAAYAEIQRIQFN
jgi:HlyD family secretion protein